MVNALTLPARQLSSRGPGTMRQIPPEGGCSDWRGEARGDLWGDYWPVCPRPLPGLQCSPFQGHDQ